MIDHPAVVADASYKPRQRLWDTVETSYHTWQHLDDPTIEQFGVTAPNDTTLQYIWFDHPDSQYRWPLPL